MSFTQKLINVSLSMAQGNYGAAGGNSGQLTGLRVQAHISNPGGQGMATASLAIFGMTQSQMNQFTLFGLQPTATGQNTVTVEAGDAGGMAQVFQGTINLAWMDAQAMPRVPFRIEAYAGSYESVLRIPPTSINGTGDVATIMGQLAQKMGLQFENNSGVNVKLSNPYLPGSARTQAATLAMHAGIEWTIDKGKLAIWPAGQARQSSGGSGIIVSAATGMIGYPAFNSKGIIVKTLFQPGVDYGNQFTVQSDIQPACGNWTMYNMELDLDSMVPHGQWMMTLYGYPASAGTTVP